LFSYETSISFLSWDSNRDSLSVATHDGVCYLYRESSQGKWNLISVTNAEGVIENVSEEINN
jgi:hypothetical protein